MNNDSFYMRRCLQLARLGEYYVAPNPMVGAVLVSADGRILAEGWHRQYGGPHAEVWCFRDAEAQGVTPDEIHTATLYVSLEPCSHYGKTPPCALLITEKHPARVVCGMQDPNPKVAGRGIQICREAGIEVTCGVLEEECRALNRRFLMLQEHHRPYIILKWAETADGFLDNRPTLTAEAETSLAPFGMEKRPEWSFRRDGAGERGLLPSPSRGSGGPLLISTALTKRLVHQMRAENMGILVGSGTALMDNPKLLTTRWPGRNPVRILLDRRGRVPEDAHLLIDANEPSDYAGLPKTLHITSHPLCSFLAEQGLHSVLVEGGCAVLESFIREGLYDEVHIEVNPHLYAQKGTPAPVFPERELLSCEKVDGNILYSGLTPHPLHQ